MKLTSTYKIQALFISILFILNIFQSITLPLIDDEAYYWVWSKHLDFGYFDHPPMIALFIKIGYFLVQGSLGVRMLSILSSLSVYIIWLIILKPKTLQENYLFLGLFGSVGFFQTLGFISTPDTPLLLFSSIFIWRWKAFTEKQTLINSLLLGIAMALMMYSKYHGALLITLTFLPFISSLLRSKWFYFSLFISLLLFSPHLYWQYTHDWVTIKYHLFERAKKKSINYPFIKWILGILLIGNPLLIYFYGKSILLPSDKKLSWTKSLKWSCLGAILFFSIFSFTRVIQPQWNLIIFISLIPLTYLTFKEKENFQIIRLSFAYIIILFIVRICLFFPTIIHKTPMYKLKQFVLEAKEVNEGIAVFERYQKASLYNYYTNLPSCCLQVYIHRFSQYDLWNSEQKIQGKTITFFGLENISSNFLFDEEGKNEFYKTVEDFHSYPKISCTVYPTNLSSEDLTQTLDIKWKNPYDTEIHLGKEMNQEIAFLFIKDKTFELQNIISIDDTIILPAKSTFENTIYIDVSQIPQGDYKIYIILKPYGISGKIISNEMSIVIH
ncbi:glycosyltransferase family 39 protein [uncultured Apibacter sp.]|uniref:ArnT family glycosyltransferase n=1 Tax=uncultured Apibacter sp. TaxID=1778616 RepID=UPI0025E7F88F|nr:glycosyltransferase family 39 protein [uncultured Apibacter sp.]